MVSGKAFGSKGVIISLERQDLPMRNIEHRVMKEWRYIGKKSESQKDPVNSRAGS